MIDSKTEDLIEPGTLNTSSMLRDPSSAASFRWGVVVVLLAVLALVYLGSKGYIVAATVNGKPIFGWDVARVVMSRYGNQTLTNLINERLIADAAQKQGVTVTQKDVSAKENELTKSLGPNVKIDDVLKYQGMTRADFDNQVKMQLTVERILGKDVKVSDTEITDFIDKNKDNMTATDEAGLQTEAKQALFSQKVNEKVQTWFTTLKAQAKINMLMK